MITTDIMGLLDTREKREMSKLEGDHISDLVEYIKSNKITRASAKLALDEVIKNGKQLSEIIEDLDLGHVSDEATLSDIIEEVLDEEAKAVEDAKQNPDIVNFLVGKVMQKTHGKADPELTLALLKKILVYKIIFLIHIDSLFPFLLVDVSNQFAQNMFHIQYILHAVS
uniref:Aspartyl/glutamyl-tRNA(Asn/Gln) amidotransferase subunit B n=1 Tax=uncultured marine thaumarchaeote AD1000_39_D02 TaxID=1455912 RepID=A0A075FVY0_9ARCH|nr:glutamyl-tRNA(Gln) amidotransferase subunit B (gatB) [uncultured marine thaumarchaeote AD1000_39_D02]